MEISANIESLQSVVSSIDKFSSKFYKSLIEDEDSNLICSPISASMVLSMAAFGATGETERELRTGLNQLTTDAEIKLGIQSLTDTLNNITTSELRLANKIFTDAKFKVKPEFINVTETYFRSTTQSINFNNRVNACAIINKWCEEQTENRIKNMIQPNDITFETRLILVNAVYFKGSWKAAFKKSQTRSKFFHIDLQTKKQVPMMHRTGNYNYAGVPNLNAHYIELPYKFNSPNDAISMFVILPNAINGLEEVEQNLDKVDFKKLHEKRNYNEINLQLPKFTIHSKFDLVETIQKLGIADIFTMYADFRRISESKPLKVDGILQKAFIEVNEEGTEAAAVTITAIGFGCAEPQRPPFNVVVDRPFFCAIVATNTGTQLFNARVIDPVAT